MYPRFLIQCKNEACKKVILRENPAMKFVVGNSRQLSCSDPETGEIVVMPNVWCKHCKKQYTYTEEDCQETSGKTIIERKLMSKRIRSEITVTEKRMLDEADSEDLENGVIEPVKAPVLDDRPTPAGLVKFGQTVKKVEVVEAEETTKAVFVEKKKIDVDLKNVGKSHKKHVEKFETDLSDF